jgi:hypothetical protein
MSNRQQSSARSLPLSMHTTMKLWPKSSWPRHRRSSDPNSDVRLCFFAVRLLCFVTITFHFRMKWGIEFGKLGRSFGN